MSEGMNVNQFKLSGDGISLAEFSKQVGNDSKLIDIYKAYDKNGDNKLSRDELAGLLGAYKMIDNGDDSLSRSERKKIKKEIKSDLSNDANNSNDGVKIKKRELNKFFDVVKQFVDPNADQDGDISYYNNDGQITGGKDKEGAYTRAYTDKGYTDTYSENNVKLYDKAGKQIGGKDEMGDYSRTYTDKGYTDTYSDRTRYYSKNGELVAGIDVNGDKWAKTNNSDGSYTIAYQSYKGDNTKPYTICCNSDNKIVGGIDVNGDKWAKTNNSDGSYTVKYDSYKGDTDTPYERYYTVDGKWVGGIDKDGDKYTRTYNDDGSYTRKYDSYKGDTTKPFEEYYNADGKLTGGIDTRGKKYTRIYNDDGSYTQKYVSSKNEPYERYYNVDGKWVGGIDAGGNKYTRVFSKDGNRIGSVYVNPDGSKELIEDTDEDSLYDVDTDIDPQGNIKTTAIEGESFNATMARLGITEAADIELFKKSNPKAARKGYFLAGVQDVKIPAELAQKLDVANMMVNKNEQLEAYKRRISGS